MRRKQRQATRSLETGHLPRGTMLPMKGSGVARHVDLIRSKFGGTYTRRRSCQVKTIWSVAEPAVKQINCEMPRVTRREIRVMCWTCWFAEKGEFAKCSYKRVCVCTARKIRSSVQVGEVTRVSASGKHWITCRQEHLATLACMK